MAITRLGNYSQLKGNTTKLPCVAATIGTLPGLTGTGITIDGVSLSVGDRVLVKDQTTAADNGIWVVAAGSWSRAIDFSLDDDVYQGLTVYINGGTVYGGKYFMLTTPGPITLGTTSLKFTIHSGILSNNATAFFQDFGADFNYTGEVIYARVVPGSLGFNIDGNAGVINRGQLCYWVFDGNTRSWFFDVANGMGAPAYQNINMLAICLGTATGNSISANDYGYFLLKGFVSTSFLMLSAADDGSPLYIQAGGGANLGKMCDPGGWVGALNQDVWRCVGYLFAYNPTVYHVIRFDPSTDYIY
jgi:hypothetical protein